MSIFNTFFFQFLLICFLYLFWVVMISIGGLGKDKSVACVSDIIVEDISIQNTLAGVRIKTWQVHLLYFFFRFILSIRVKILFYFKFEVSFYIFNTDL